MISSSKTTFSHYNLKILRPEVTKNIKNVRNKFCEFWPWRITSAKKSLFLYQKNVSRENVFLIIYQDTHKGHAKNWGMKKMNEFFSATNFLLQKSFHHYQQFFMLEVDGLLRRSKFQKFHSDGRKWRIFLSILWIL